MEQRRHYRTLVLSDIHLGTSHSKTEEVSHFLSHVDCDRLILNGDIIDGWHLKKGGTRKWQPRHTRFFKVLMKMMERQGTEIIYVRGNHDDFLDNLAPLTFANLRIVKDYELESGGKRYFVTHGDIFDRVTTQMKWLALLGDLGYTLLLAFNSFYNRYRVRHGKPYYSLSQHVKQKVKSAVNYISDFEHTLAEFAVPANTTESFADTSIIRIIPNTKAYITSIPATGWRPFPHWPKMKTDIGTSFSIRTSPTASRKTHRPPIY